MVAKPAENGRRLSPMVSNFFLATTFGSQLIGMTLAFLATVIFFGYRLFTEQYAQIKQIFQVVDPGMEHELIFNDILIQNMIGVGVAVILYVVIMIILIVRANHKYAGPLVPILRSIETIAAGDYSHKITIREGDQLHSLVIALNNLTDTLAKRHGPGTPASEKDKKALS